MKITQLLSDNPVSEDAFGAHSKIAESIASIILDVDDKSKPRSIGLGGDWGSGKSSVIKMLSEKLLTDKRTHIFHYDAWAHQGDGLRRVFLDDLVRSLNPFLKNKEEFQDRLWKSEEEIITYYQPMIRGYFLVIFLVLFFTLPNINGMPFDALFDEHDKSWIFVNFIHMYWPITYTLLVFLFFILYSLSPFDAGKNFFFGPKEQRRGPLDLLSPFLQKVAGTVERKLKTTPTDSILAFKKCFRDVLQSAKGSGTIDRFVVIIDNLDRLEADQARQFWSTMQSFFERSGLPGSEQSVDDSLWLIVPFAYEGIGPIFSAGETSDQRKVARSYAEKSFDIAYYVPPPIHVGVRQYIYELLEAALPSPGFDKTTRENIAGLYDLHRRNAIQSDAAHPTPRQIKQFVNQLVGLYRTRDTEIPVEALGAYLLNIDEISRDLHNFELPENEAAFLPSQPEWLQQLAAVHFGVSLPDAAQIVLLPIIEDALTSKSSGKLSDAAVRTGFSSVLLASLTSMASDRLSVGKVLELISLLNSVKLPPSVDIYGSWILLRRYLIEARNLGRMPENVDLSPLNYPAFVEGRTPELFVGLKNGLENRWLESATIDQDVDVHKKNVERMARNWSELFVTISDAIHPKSLGPVEFPLVGPGAVIGIASISARNRELLPSLIVNDERLQLSDGLIGVTIDEVVKSSSAKTVKFLLDRCSATTQDDTADALAFHMDNESPDSQRLALLALTLIGIGAAGRPNAWRLLADHWNGSSSLAEFANSADERDLSVWILVLALACPEYQPVMSARPSPGASELLAIFQGQGTTELVEAVVDLVITFGLANRFLARVSSHEHWLPLGAIVVSALVERGCRFSPTLKTYRSAQALRAHWPTKIMDGNKVPFALEPSIANLKDIAGELRKRSLSKEDRPLAVRLLKYSSGHTKKALAIYLTSKLNEISATEWKEDFVSAKPNLVGPRALSKAVMDAGVPLELGSNVADAIEAVAQERPQEGQARGVAIKARLVSNFGLIHHDLQANLRKRLWRRLFAIEDTAQLAATLLMIEPIINAIDASDAGTVLDHTFGKLLNDMNLERSACLQRIYRANVRILKRQTNAMKALQKRIEDGIKSYPPYSEGRKGLRALKKEMSSA